MKRLLTSTTALSVALAFSTPMPLMAQTMMDDGKVVADDGTVLCEPTADVPCDLKEIRKQLRKDARAEANAEVDAAAAAAAIAAQADADAAAAATAQTDADAAAAATAQADADAAAAATAQADADAAAAAIAQADADAAAAAAAIAAQADAAASAAQAEADAAAAAQMEADSAAAAQAETDAEAAAAAADEADAAANAAAQADADATAAAQAEADADAAAAAIAAQAEADAAAKAASDAAAAADAAAQAQTDATAKAAAALADGDAAAAAAAQAEADAAAAAQVQADADATAAAAAQADADVAAKAAEDAAAAAAAVAVTDPVAIAPDTPVSSEDAGDAAMSDTGEVNPDSPVEVLVPTTTEVDALTAVLEETPATQAAAPEAAAAAAVEAPAEGQKPSDVAASPDAQVTTQTVTEADTRSSDQEFTRAPVKVGEDRKSGLSNLEKVGLIALGALVVGAILKDGREVVSNTGDRVVVRDRDGGYQVYKDDDTLIRQPGSTVRTESYRDGSTRTIVEKADGTQIVTVRDASGRVLRRAAYDDRGRELVLIDDLEQERPIIISELPRPRIDRVTISTNDGNAALKARLAAEEAKSLGRSFSLRQIREIAQVRALAATIDVDTITFDSGSSAIKVTEAEKLADLGGLITDMIDANPGEVFLIEGHTDAVGSGSLNLALSDRRAESVALALTEYFDVPPENLVVQGYGESELRVQTERDERANRRVAVRIITPLMRVASN